MSTLEKIIRVIAGIVVIITGLFLLDGVNGNELGVALAVAGLFPLVTALFNYCPLYRLSGGHLKKER